MELKQKILRYCLWLLSRRDYSVFEVEKKLKSKDFPIDEIEIVIAYLNNAKLLDDKRFAENYLRIHHNRGKIRIKYELIKKGIKDDLIQSALNSASSESQFAEAMEVAKKWLERKNRPDSDQYKLKQLLVQKLSRQGFEYEIVREVANKLVSN